MNLLINKELSQEIYNDAGEARITKAKEYLKNGKINIIKANYEKFEQKDVSVAGRIIAKRIMGKASFCTIQDCDEKIQSYVSINFSGKGLNDFVSKTTSLACTEISSVLVLNTKPVMPIISPIS